MPRRDDGPQTVVTTPGNDAMTKITPKEGQISVPDMSILRARFTLPCTKKRYQDTLKTPTDYANFVSTYLLMTIILLFRHFINTFFVISQTFLYYFVKLPTKTKKSVKYFGIYA